MSPSLAERPQRLLVVDDCEQGREMLRDLLQDEGHSVLTASDGREALLQASQDPPDLILMDCDMPNLDGFEACRLLKSQAATRLVPVIMFTGIANRERRLRGIAAGCDDFLAKPIDTETLLARMRKALRAKAFVDELSRPEAVLVSLATALEAKDECTRGHSERVAALARSLAADAGLAAEEQHDVWRAGLLHDIGKIGLTDEMLRRPGALTPEEMRSLRRHAEASFDICKPLASLHAALPLIRGHHERMDGSGYPDGLKGALISPALHCLIVADYYDVLTSRRPYREALLPEQALDVLRLEAALGRLQGETVERLADWLRQAEARVLSSAR